MIFLVRHGQTELNRLGRFQGRSDSALTDLGLDQARRVGERLRALALADPGQEWSIDASPLGRTRRTAQIIADLMGLGPPRIEPRLTEIDFGSWEGLTRDEIIERRPDLTGQTVFFMRSPDGEQFDQLKARAEDWMTSVPLGARRIAVCHAGIGRAIRGLYAGLGVEEMRAMDTPQDAFHRLHEGRIERIDCA